MGHWREVHGVGEFVSGQAGDYFGPAAVSNIFSWLIWSPVGGSESVYRSPYLVIIHRHGMAKQIIDCFEASMFYEDDPKGLVGEDSVLNTAVPGALFARPVRLIMRGEVFEQIAICR